MERSETFDGRRFCRYFSYEVKKTVRGQGLFILLASLVPAMLFLFYGLISLSVKDQTAKMEVWSSLPLFKVLIAAIVFVLFFLIFPILRYGHLTAKTDGKEEILLPVSSGEKFLSMILVSLVVVPLVFMGIYFTTDLIFTQFTPVIDVALFKGLIGQGPLSTDETYYSIDNIYVFFYPYMVTAAGLAGGLVFKKHKIAFTFLTCTVLFILFYAIILNTVFMKGYEPVDIAKYMIPVWSAIQTVVAIACCTVVWSRIKRIQL